MWREMPQIVLLSYRGSKMPQNPRRSPPPDPIHEAVHPDYVWRLSGHYSWAGSFEGQDNVRRNLLRPLFNRFETEYRAKAVNLIAEGEFVVAEVRGDVMAKSWERYDNEYCFIFRFRDGKIAEITEYCDSDLIERVLGSYGDAVEAVKR